MGLLRYQAEHTDITTRSSIVFSTHKQIIIMFIVSSYIYCHQCCVQLRFQLLFVVCSWNQEEQIHIQKTYSYMLFPFMFFPRLIILLLCRQKSFILLLLFKIENKQKTINIDKYSIFSFFFCYRVQTNSCIYFPHKLFLFNSPPLLSFFSLLC